MCKSLVYKMRDCISKSNNICIFIHIKNEMPIRFNKNTLFSEYLHLIFYQYLLVKIRY